MENNKINLKYTLLFGGGAIRGVAYCGAYKYLEEINLQFDKIAGSSVGAVFASLVAIGYNADEISDIMLSINYELFRDIQIGIGPQFALSKGEVFLDWLRELIEKKFYGDNYKKGSHKAVTFADLKKDLVIITTDLSNFECKEFSKKETPDFEVAKAVRISSGMPGLMKPYEYNNRVLVDGDLQKSAPMWYLTKNLQPENERIMELRLEGDFQGNDHNTVEFLNAIYSYATKTGTKFLKELYGNRDKYDYVVLDTGDLNIVDFNIAKEKREELIDGGYNQIKNYFTATLPEKKKHLLEIYKELDKQLNSCQKMLNANNINQLKCNVGEIYMNLCTSIDIINDYDKNLLDNFKNTLLKNIQYPALFGKMKLNNENLVKASLQACINQFSDRIKEYKNFIEEINCFK